MGLLDWLKNEGGAPGRATIEEQLANILGPEERTLQRLGIPVPPLREAIRTSATGLLMPIFDLSRYLFLPVEAKAGDYIGYFVAANPKELRSARFVLENSGAHELVRRFDGLWLNRDPYALHKNLNWYGTFGGGFSATTDLRGWLKLPPPLRVVAAFSPPEIYDRITWRERLFSVVLEGAKFPLRVEDLDMQINCADPLQLAATVPSKAIKPSGQKSRWTAVRIISCDTATCTAYDDFLEGLREHNDYVTFEMIAAENKLDFQLAFPSSGRDAIMAQIEKHLPGAVAREVEGAPAIRAELYRTVACPSSPLGTFDSGSSPPGDRCGSLARVLRGGSAGHFCCIQIVLAPLSLGYFLRLREELRLIEMPDHCSRRIETFAAKFPGWLVCIKLFATHPDILHCIGEGWLRAYESDSRAWIFSPAEIVPGIDQKVDIWDVLETGELASILYAPGAISCSANRAV